MHAPGTSSSHRQCRVYGRDVLAAVGYRYIYPATTDRNAQTSVTSLVRLTKVLVRLSLSHRLITRILLSRSLKTQRMAGRATPDPPNNRIRNECMIADETCGGEMYPGHLQTARDTNDFFMRGKRMVSCETNDPRGRGEAKLKEWSTRSDTFPPRHHAGLE